MPRNGAISNTMGTVPEYPFLWDRPLAPWDWSPRGRSILGPLSREFWDTLVTFGAIMGPLGSEKNHAFHLQKIPHAGKG